MARMPAVGGGGLSWSPGLLDRAETFAETDVTVEHSQTKVTGGSVELFKTVGSEATRTDDDGSGSASDKEGIVVNPNTSLDGVSPTLSANISGATTAYLYRRSNSTLLDTADISDLSPGDSFDLLGDLSSGSDYLVLADADGNSYTEGYYGSFSTTSSTDIELTAGWVNGTGGYSDTGTAYNFVSVAALTGDALSGSVTVQWPMPDDLAEWDSVYYDAAPDGGGIEVYAIDPSDGSRLSDALDDPGDISGLSNTTNLAFEVVVSRPTESENPRLESIYRRRKIT